VLGEEEVRWGTARGGGEMRGREGPGGGLDVLLVNPGGRRGVYQALGENLSAVEPPIWAGLHAAFLGKRGLSVEILDANALDLDEREVARIVGELDPRLVAVVVYGHNPSASTQVMPAASRICREIAAADPGRAQLLLGGHIAALPERTLEEEAADFVCDGEGPYTVLDLVEALRAHGGKERIGRDMLRVRGLLWRDGGEIVHNPPAPLVVDLDEEMPGIAWDLLPMEKYRSHNWQSFGGFARTPYAALYTTLGCPFRCGFCCIQAPFRSGERALGYKPGANSYRRWSAEKVASQVDLLTREHGVRTFKIADELFVLDPTHVESVCDRLIRSGGERNLWAYARVDTAGKPALLAKMREAGIRWLALGIESANARVRKDVSKGYREDRILEAVANIRAAGIHVLGNFIFGLPEDDLDSMRETLDLAFEILPEFANFNAAMAYPGSALHRQALEEGWPLPEDWEGYSQYSRSSRPLPTRYLDGKAVLEFRDRAFRTFFESGRYKAHVREVFGRGAVEEIERMTSAPLARDPRPVG